MFPLDSTTLDELVEEIRRYLEAVDLFRSEGSELRWLPSLEQPNEHQTLDVPFALPWQGVTGNPGPLV